MHGTEPPDWALPSWDALDVGGRPAGRAGPGHPSGAFGLRVLGVTEVTHVVRDALREDRRLADLWVEGEVGRVTVSSAGHAYFTLRDEKSQLPCVFFREDRQASAFEPQTGMRVVVHGRIDVFDAQGVYQCYVAAIQPAGFGDLALRFEQTKARLAAEGLFEARRKRSLPARPATIGVVTSLSGAVVHDIRRVLARRWPLVTVVVSACRVQGGGAAESIVAALGRLARYDAICREEGLAEAAPGCVILARGGGSLEDLFAFNDERVVRAIAAHPVPVVSGVGHETDVTLADFVADVRAPTPSAAAEVCVPDRADVLAALRARRWRLDEAASREMMGRSRRVAAERRALDGLRPAAQLAAARERAGYLLDRATATMVARFAADRRASELAGRGLVPLVQGRLRNGRGRLASAGAALGALGPEATLARGYAIVRRVEDGAIVRDPAASPPGTRLRLRVARGEIAARAEGERGA